MRLMSFRALTVALAVVGGAAAVAFPKLIVAEAVPESGGPVIASPQPADVAVIRVVPAAPTQVRRPPLSNPTARRDVTPAPGRSSLTSNRERPAAPGAAASPKPRPVTPVPAPTAAPKPSTPSAPAHPAPAAPPAAQPDTTVKAIVRTLVAAADENVEDAKDAKDEGDKKPKKAKPKKSKKAPHGSFAAPRPLPAGQPAGVTATPSTEQPSAVSEAENANGPPGRAAGEGRGHEKDQGKDQGKDGQGNGKVGGKP